MLRKNAIRRFSGLAITFLGIVLLTACSGTLTTRATTGTGQTSGGGTTSGGNPPGLQTMLDSFQHPAFTDATCTIATDTPAQTVSGVAIPASTLSGDCEVTSNPQRSHTILHFTTSSGKKHTVEGITDRATNTAYTKSSIDGGSVPATWTKTTIDETTNAGSSSIMSLTTMKNATFVGADTVNGVAVWHLRGQADLPSASGLKEQLDYYLRQDNQYPLEIKGIISGSLQSTTTLIYTKYNTGINIALPSPDQVT
ncbi:MAG: hypothetical protein ACM3N4_10935, partial [Nitrososphaerota archaeon]